MSNRSSGHSCVRTESSPKGRNQSNYVTLFAVGKLIPYLEASVAHASILTMMAISFERFYAICKPLKVSYKCTKLR